MGQKLKPSGKVKGRAGRSARSSRVYIGVGSNKGNRGRNIRKALRLLQEQQGIDLEAVSPFYETRPDGGPPGQRNFWNGVVRIRSAWPSRRLLGILKKVEARVGRRPGKRWAAREVDLDILVRGREVVRTKRLSVPHLRMKDRAFVLRPLSDLAPGLRDPVTHMTVAQCLRRVSGRRRFADKKRVAEFLYIRGQKPRPLGRGGRLAAKYVVRRGTPGFSPGGTP